MKKITSLFLILLTAQVYSQDFSKEIKLIASDRQSSDQFGKVVDIDGDIAVVGVPLNDLNSSGTDSIYSAGAAYVYWRNESGNWVQLQKLVASDRAFMDEFGSAVSVSGSYIAVAAPKEDHNVAGTDSLKTAGAVYIFELQGDGSFLEKTKLVASDRAELDYFGFDVAINGNTIVVGADAEDDDASGSNSISNAGSAYIFTRDASGNWIQTQKIVASDRRAGNNFGYSVAIDKATIVIGAWLCDYNSDGTDSVYHAGAAYVFEYNGSTWLETAKISSIDRAELDEFGQSVAISGNVAVIGAFAEDEDEFGGNTLDRAGSAYIFTKQDDGNWTQTKKIVASDRNATDGFATTLDIDGDYIVIGAAAQDEDAEGGDSLLIAGAAYIFQKGVDGTWSQLQKIVPSDRTMFDTFGVSVGISGKYIISGANLEDHNTSGADSISDAGSAYIFETLTLLSSAEIEDDYAIQVFPNPFSSSFTAKCDFTGRIDVTMSNLQGQVVMQQTVSNCNQIVVPSVLKNGTYSLQCVIDKKVFTKEIVKQ